MHEGWLASAYKSQNTFALSPIDLGEIEAPPEFVSCIIAVGRTVIRATKARGYKAETMESKRHRLLYLCGICSSDHLRPFFLALLHFFFKK